ncbi:hypothetical protein Maut_02207 [Moorella thermoacetica]|uniref:Uncharacterized protein n=1 Tax=Neomoorella thermoacetica TaxID=1525 RepID=A0AAC9HJ69_NEOTH|nr:hypothetical protein [Moorella thermoacetica]AOQ24635.1 hypothetical protein Maut_02207 [Moorella thermoacetica]
MGLIEYINNTTPKYIFTDILATQALTYKFYDLVELLGWKYPYRYTEDDILAKIGDISFAPRQAVVSYNALHNKMVDLYLDYFAQLSIQRQYDMCHSLYSELISLQKAAVTIMCRSRTGGLKDLTWSKQDILMARDLIERSAFSLIPLVVLRIVRNVFLGQWSDEGLKVWACRFLSACGYIFGYSITQIAYILAKFVDDTTLVKVFLGFLSKKKRQNVIEMLRGLRNDLSWNDIVHKSVMLSSVGAYTLKTVFAALAQHQEPPSVYDFVLTVPSSAVRRMVYLNPAYNTCPKKLVNILHTDYKNIYGPVAALYWARALLHPYCPKDFYLELVLQNNEFLRQLGQYFLQKKTLAA